MDKNILKEFLKSSFMENFILYPTPEGFPLRSFILPLLANLTLNGLQDCLGKDFLSTRYADDFVVLGKFEEELRRSALPKIRSFLKERGLKLVL